MTELMSLDSAMQVVEELLPPHENGIPEREWQGYRHAVLLLTGRHPEEWQQLHYHATHTKEQINKYWLRHTGRSWTGD